MKHLAPLVAIVSLAAASPLAARSVELAIPAGTVSEVAIALARATGTSIVIADPALGRTRIGAIRGRMGAEAAVRKLARAGGMEAVRVGPNAWRLVAAPRRAASRPRPERQARVVAVAATVSQPPPEAEGPPIIVTATKRDLTYAETPGQVTLLDGARL
ncbi:MAG: TonB-dependent receptor, partial [Candidatus Accumulibacter sp.]|nr:TonB-dependent receptor [Accumulibacter sp.]